MAMGSVVTRRLPLCSRVRRCGWGGVPPMAMGTVLTRRPGVWSRISRPGEHPMDYGTVVTRGRRARTDTHREGAPRREEV